ncbi:MAG: beta-ketoacyl-[acyl-carrier-protein] synthase family protein [Phycisphaerales bacterium]|nr:beta-ketoacyl-[acyl-carrier-protein] synthase family protein [Phycisphaerales bacterium]
MTAGNAKGNRVVVTGLGAVTCLGLTAEQMWCALLEGKSGIRKLSLPDCQGFEISVAGEIHGFDPVEVLGAEWAYVGDRFTQIGLAAALEAIETSGLDMARGELSQAGVVLANAHYNCGRDVWGGKGLQYFPDSGPGTDGMGDLVEIVYRDFCEKHRGYTIEPNIVYRQNPDYPTHLVARYLRTAGPLFTVSSACVSGAKTVERGLRWLRRGQCEVALCGGCESVVDPWGIWFLNAMRALTTFSADPHHASRPFDRDRSGFVLAEGAGVLVLETLDHALRRDATILAEVVGAGGSANANSLYAPEPVGDGVAGAMRAALLDAQLDPEAIDVVFAHATSTGIGDPAEADGIRIALGDQAPRASITATKSMMGHAIAAAGALGAIQCVQAIRDGVVPPILNLENVDEACTGLDYVRGEAAERRIDYALNNAFGFGGANASNIFKRFTG